MKNIKRICAACRTLKNRCEMIKITKVFKTGEIVINPTSKQVGRSIYVCKNEECIKLFVKKKQIARAFKCDNAKEIEEKLMGFC